MQRCVRTGFKLMPSGFFDRTRLWTWPPPANTGAVVEERTLIAGNASQRRVGNLPACAIPIRSHPTIALQRNRDLPVSGPNEGVIVGAKEPAPFGHLVKHTAKRCREGCHVSVHRNGGGAFGGSRPRSDTSSRRLRPWIVNSRRSSARRRPAELLRSVPAEWELLSARPSWLT